MAFVVHEYAFSLRLWTAFDRIVCSIEIRKIFAQLPVITLQFALIDLVTRFQVKLVLATVVHWPFVAMVPTAVTVNYTEIPETHFLAQCPSLLDLMLVMLKHNELPSGLATCLDIGISVGHYPIEVTVLSV